ncbi:MAG: hypothetical protein AVDCRST_MAG93-1994, partial [uncultured Chloroflexia bacterium]
MTHMIHHDAILGERESLLRFCARYTGDPDAAEDITQLTLLNAWRHEQQLKDPQARRAWLLSIARHQCLMWGRTNSRERSRFVVLDTEGDNTSVRLADDFDLEVELERSDLARLLDRAMGLLEPDVRAMLVLRYVEESSQAEMAERLGLTEGAVEARLHRGKLALKRVLATNLGEEAAAYGLIAPSEVGWEGTRIWCPSCSQQQLLAWFRPEEGQLYMRCPACSGPDAHFIHADHGDGFKNIRSVKPGVTRVLKSIHNLFRVLARDGAAPCPGCGQWLPILRGAPPWVPADRAISDSIYVWHPDCGGYDAESWHSLTWSLPEVRAFWGEHPRMRFIPERFVEAAGSPAVVTGFEDLAGSAR